MIKPFRDNDSAVGQPSGKAIHFVNAIEGSCIHHTQKEHMLAYVYSGQLIVHDGVSQQAFGAENSVFIRKNHRVSFSIEKEISRKQKLSS